MQIEVMLMDNVKKLGKAGEIVKVAPGYFRNCLAPKGLASLATEAAKRRLKKLEAERAARAVEAQRGVKLTRGQFSIGESLREVGEYEAKIDLGHGVTSKCVITILNEDAPAEE